MLMHIETMHAGAISPEQMVAFERGCAGKDKYPSESAAYAALKLMKRGLVGKKNGLGGWDGLHSYWCQFCGEWHLGH